MDNLKACDSVWLKSDGDMIAGHSTLLSLRADGTYTKQFGASVGGGLASVSGSFGGTHEGTWTQEGQFLHLSGDGNWPAYTEDLRLFRRLS